MGYIHNRCFLANKDSFIATDTFITSYNTQTCNGLINTTIIYNQCTNEHLFGEKNTNEHLLYHKYSMISVPKNQWITVLYYTQSNCQGMVIQFTTQRFSIGLQTGCNGYNPTDRNSNKIVSVFINYSIDYYDYPINLLTEDKSYIIKK